MSASSARYGFIRLSCSPAMEDLQEGLDRLETAVGATLRGVEA